METEDKKKRKKALFIFLILFLIFLICLVFYNQVNDKHELKVQKGERIDLKKPVSKKSKQDDMIDYVGHDQQLISKDSPYLLLINPSGNDVYFQYDVISEGKVIAETKLFKPNLMVKVDLYHNLPVGEHDITLKLRTYDLKTKEECSGINENFKVVIE